MKRPVLYASLLEHLKGVREVLDLGCGKGPLLRLCRDVGIAARGMDVDAEAVRHCREEGLSAEVGDLFSLLEGVPPASGPDALALCHVVEHYPPQEVRRILTGAFRLLPEGGRLAVVTPNSKNLGIVCDSFWRDLSHARLYPRELLAALGRESGFSVIASGVDACAAPRGLSRLVNRIRRRLIGDYFSGPDAFVVFRK